MTYAEILTSAELIEQLQSTQLDPFAVVTQSPVDEAVVADKGSYEQYNRLKREFDESMRLGVSLKRMAAP